MSASIMTRRIKPSNVTAGNSREGRKPPAFSYRAAYKPRLDTHRQCASPKDRSTQTPMAPWDARLNLGIGFQDSAAPPGVGVKPRAAARSAAVHPETLCFGETSPHRQGHRKSPHIRFARSSLSTPFLNCDQPPKNFSSVAVARHERPRVQRDVGAPRRAGCPTPDSSTKQPSSSKGAPI